MKVDLRFPAIIPILILISCLLFVPPALAGGKDSDMPNSVRWLLTDVGRLIDQKSYGQALEKIREFQAKGGPAPADGEKKTDAYHHPMLYFALGNCHLLLQQYAPAEKAFQEVIRQRPENLSARLNLAKAYYEHGLYAKAAHHFKTAYDLSTDNDKTPDSLYYCAAAYLMAQDYKQAISVFEQLLANHPGDVVPAWKANYVHALLGDGQSRRALPHIVALIDVTTGDERERWQEVLIHQYLQLKMEKKARAYAEQLTREAPTNSRWWKLLSQIRLYNGDYADALAAMTIYGYLEPLTVEEKKVWADLNLHLGIPAQAAPVYAGLLADDDIDSRIIKKLVSAYRQLGRTDDALVQLERCGQLEKDTDLLMLRADLLYEMKQFKDAAAAYRQAAEKDHPHCGKAWLMAGYAAWQNQEIGPSRQAFEHAAKYNKQRKSALAAIRQLAAMN